MDLLQDRKEKPPKAEIPGAWASSGSQVWIEGKGWLEHQEHIFPMVSASSE